jgi:hypothetical protein
MTYNGIINENQLDEWVRSNSRVAEGVIVELVWRLVAASSPKPKERRFPLEDSINQTGEDGFLDTEFAFNPFVPEGQSFWEIGTGTRPQSKATKDYNDRTTATDSVLRSKSTLIIVTPLSGRRGWKQPAQAKWLKTRRDRKDWFEIQVIDGTKLIDWLHHFPAVEQWIAIKMGLPAQYIQTPEQRWIELKSIGDPPPLAPDVFLTNRETACAKLTELFYRTTLQLKLDTRFPDQVADFVAAYITSLDSESKIDTAGRCLIISDRNAWNAITTLNEAHVLVADFDLDDADPTGTKLLERARRASHAVIFGGMPGGIPHPNRVPIPNPQSYQLKEALEKAGYKEERARVLAQKSGGNLTTLSGAFNTFP